MQIKRLTPADPDFPAVLQQIPDPPTEIYVAGNMAALEAEYRLAVVGSRKVTAYGQQVTRQLVEQLAGEGVAIISGLALGLDAVAHQATLDAGGIAIAVLGSSLDRITPATNHWLARKIIEQGGVLLSEYPPGSITKKWHFIARNRLVAGLSQAVMVPEAGLKSGALHTAGFALDQGKTVMAVPGRIDAPISSGTNNLLKTGAVTVTDYQDVLLALGIPVGRPARQLKGSNEAETIVLRLLQAGVTHIDGLGQESRLETRLFQQTLTMLEIGGRIRALGGGHWALRP